MHFQKYFGLLVVFLISFFIRYGLIQQTPNANSWIDLSIYIDGGQLVSNGINPYDFSDNIHLRGALRMDTIAYNVYTSETQERWNFYASGNLPLSLLLFGAIDRVAEGDPYIYRLIFALLDSLCVVFMTLFIFELCPSVQLKQKIVLILGIGIISPILLYMGVIYPEDKGTQILLMIGAIYFSKKQHFFYSVLFLAASIVFKGIGVFIAPLCLYYFIGEPKHIHGFYSFVNVRKSILFTLAIFFIVIQFYILYYPEVFEMMTKRLSQNIDGSMPGHASQFRFLELICPGLWSNAKLFFTIVLALLGIYFLIKRMNIAVATAVVLIWFLNVSLLQGSLDRANIGLVSSILLLGISQIRGTLILALYYTFASMILFVSGYLNVQKLSAFDSELLDSAFCLGFTLIFIGILLFNINLPSIILVRLKRITKGFNAKVIGTFLVFVLTSISWPVHSQNLVYNSNLNIRTDPGVFVKLSENNSKKELLIKSFSSRQTPSVYFADVKVMPGKTYTYLIGGHSKSSCKVYQYVTSKSGNLLWPGAPLKEGITSGVFNVPQNVDEVTLGLAFFYPKNSNEYIVINDIGLFLGDVNEWQGAPRLWPPEIAPTHWLYEENNPRLNAFTYFCLVVCNSVLILIIWLEYKGRRKHNLNTN